MNFCTETCFPNTSDAPCKHSSDGFLLSR
uniref:Uncharacterized protein n=1 Tax=Anguilla anguilla TaxID=7936 RepID=A0A0E9UCT0_ANGAN